MLWIIGTLVVLICVFVGYLGGGGHLHVLWQPFEFLIIVGSSVGAFITANTKATLKAFPGGLGDLLKGTRYKKESYLELLSLLYLLFKLARTKGMLALESHIEKPNESPIFNQFPGFLSNHHAVVFLCDYMRLVTLGSDNPSEIEALLDQELETHETEIMQLPGAIHQMSEGLPALGIVAAVLGVIHTMGAITEPPEVLGRLIGSALVGTFLGVLLSYGFVGPIASGLHAVYQTDAKYLECIKVALLAHLNGYAPSVSVEFARKAILSQTRPTFYEVEETVSALPSNF
ncbi:MAG: flagellar motor stator protein MotA [Alphaproteobacteria bacterium]